MSWGDQVRGSVLAMRRDLEQRETRGDRDARESPSDATKAVSPWPHLPVPLNTLGGGVAPYMDLSPSALPSPSCHFHGLILLTDGIHEWHPHVPP